MNHLPTLGMTNSFNSQHDENQITKVISHFSVDRPLKKHTENLLINRLNTD
jgi:hypothetical protein